MSVTRSAAGKVRGVPSCFLSYLSYIMYIYVGTAIVMELIRPVPMLCLIGLNRFDVYEDESVPIKANLYHQRDDDADCYISIQKVLR